MSFITVLPILKRFDIRVTGELIVTRLVVLNNKRYANLYTIWRLKPDAETLLSDITENTTYHEFLKCDVCMIFTWNVLDWDKERLPIALAFPESQYGIPDTVGVKLSGAMQQAWWATEGRHLPDQSLAVRLNINIRSSL